VRIQAESIGDGAAKILSTNAAGEVEAVFSRSLYLRFPAGLVCLGHAAIGHGPLNLPSHVQSIFDWRQAVRPGEPARCDGSSISAGPLQIRLDKAETRHSRHQPVWCRTTVRRGMDHLHALMPSDIPAGGLGCLLLSRDSGDRCADRVLRSAAPAINALTLWIASESVADPSETAIMGLLGLGPGLTPSGDDFIGGVAASLRMAGKGDLADRLGCVIERLGPGRTNEISLAHLRAAIRFGLSEKLRDVAAAIFQADVVALRAGLVRLTMAEHHSSWDTLAGIATTLDALVARESQEEWEPRCRAACR